LQLWDEAKWKLELLVKSTTRGYQGSWFGDVWKMHRERNCIREKPANRKEVV